MSRKRKKHKMTNPICCFDATIPCCERPSDDILEILESLCKEWCFQLERGNKTGYKHFQARFSLKDRMRQRTLEARLTSYYSQSGSFSWHVSPTSTCNIGNYDYCTKDHTRIAGPWMCEKLLHPDDDSDAGQYIPQCYRGTPNYWQKEFIDGWLGTTYGETGIPKVGLSDSRHVHMIVDTRGNNGKTWFAAYLKFHLGGFRCPAVNDSKELLQVVHGWLSGTKNRKPGPIIFDFTRSMPKKHLLGIFGAIEEIKNGFVSDMRYHYKEWTFEPPHVIVLTNKCPNLSYLSLDRWVFWTIGEQRELLPYCPPPEAQEPEPEFVYMNRM